MRKEACPYISMVIVRQQYLLPITEYCFKHIAIKYRLIWNVIDRKEMDMKYISSNQSVADVMTKSFGAERD